MTFCGTLTLMHARTWSRRAATAVRTRWAISNVTISSRTPEGLPNHCPVCGSDVTIEPSIPFGDAPCPHCGVLLWFLAGSSGTRFISKDTTPDISDRIAQILSDKLGVPVEELPDSFDDLAVDSIDVVELVMALEAEFPK